MFKETFWYPVNYAHISSVDYSLIRSSFQQSRVLVSWFPGMQGWAAALPVGSWCSFLWVHHAAPSQSHPAVPWTTGKPQPLPFVLLNCRIDPWRKPFPSCCCAEMIHSFSITQLRLTAKQPEFIECTNSKPKLHFFSYSKSRADQLRKTTGLWLKPSSEIWRTGDSLTLLYFDFLP